MSKSSLLSEFKKSKGFNSKVEFEDYVLDHEGEFEKEFGDFVSSRESEVSPISFKHSSLDAQELLRSSGVDYDSLVKYAESLGANEIKPVLIKQYLEQNVPKSSVNEPSTFGQGSSVPVSSGSSPSSFESTGGSPVSSGSRVGFQGSNPSSVLEVFLSNPDIYY
jgi:hypothetical protein